ncbi:GNAT family N-acetyltransferase [Terrihabitans sp. B22-R8]|uniref:GNAT family N-acetyltransferase n=1 Tax=Terrihabitans sp. B22-R8 TaxID=3425128 RepID=UPI00403C61AE
MTSLPPGYSPQHKHSFVARRDGLPVGLLDVLRDYPLAGTAFIGLLAVRESVQGSGAGRALVHEAETFARDVLKANVLRLAVVEANPVAGFWTKIGFRPTGEVRPYEGEAVTSRAVLMEKEL